MSDGSPSAGASPAGREGEGSAADGPAGAGVEVHLNRMPGSGEVPGEPLEPALRRAVRLALATSDRPLSGELSITCLDEAEIAGLNRRWLDREGPTDVLAFDLGEGERLTGDVYLCPAVARRQAAEAEVGLREELVRLAVHGTLHVLGHDHPEDDERWSSAMFELQEELVARALDRA